MTKQTLENKLNAQQIVREANMSARPEFYSGRGATSSDLNYTTLEKIYQGIQRAHGEKAANQFAQMVSDIPQLSATDFLLTLYNLERCDWKWDKKLLGNEKGIYIHGKTNQEKMVVGIATIGGILFGNNSRDETSYIRGEFLKKHNIKIPYSKKSRESYLHQN